MRCHIERGAYWLGWHHHLLEVRGGRVVLQQDSHCGIPAIQSLVVPKEKEKVCPGANVLATPSKVINGDGDGGHLSILGRWRSALNTTFTGAAVVLWLWGG